MSVSQISLIKLVILLCLCSEVLSQKAVWDNLVDLCYWPRSARPSTRCEGNDNIKFEKRLYRDTIPYWCIAINNVMGSYSTLTIEYDGIKATRLQDNYYAREINSESENQDRFNLLNEVVELVVYPSNIKYNLQKILSIKLDSNEVCDSSRLREEDPLFQNQENTNVFRYLNHCFEINTRSHRDRSRCELLDEVIIEEFLFNNEVNFYCIVLDKNLRKNSYRNESETIYLKLSDSSNGNHRTSFTPKANHRISSSPNEREYSFIRNDMRIAVYPNDTNLKLSEISSLKVNGQESCGNIVRQSKQSCGQLKIKHKTLVSFGLQTYPGQYPWHVGLFEYNQLVKIYKCGGSIISPSAILTAAHCVDTDQGVIVAGRLRVEAGKHDISTSSEFTKEYRVNEVLIHDEWDKENVENDIAILKLQTYIAYSNYIQPICLTTDKIRFVDKFGSVPGWGKNEHNTFESFLREASMPIVSKKECKKSNRDFFQRFLYDGNFCAGLRNGTSVCSGDSGGGLVFNFNDGWYIRGIVSLSSAILDENQTKRCNNVEYVIFTDVTEYYEWIVSNL